MTAKTLMVVGTMSSVGKSMLVTGLCRIFARRGVRVTPFKAQNMSNNAAVCADGGEIGRAQFTQALAAGIAPTIQMNPVLLKPEADMRSQVIVDGRIWDTLPARSYYRRKKALWSHITNALDHLRSEYELVIMEGAGSPVELNLKPTDSVNMAVAVYAGSPTVLVGDIDRGGVFAQLLGTLDLLEPNERDLVRGLVINKFRGDPTLFEDGISILEQRSGIPILGVVPYAVNHGIPEEDAVVIDERQWQYSSYADGEDSVTDIAVIALPRIANFDDFDPLAAEPGVQVRYVRDAADLGAADAIIIPGSKSTISDLRWMQQTGIASGIVNQAQGGVAVVGICGGYQMLGQTILDPHQQESNHEESTGLGLLSDVTVFDTRKTTQQVCARIGTGQLWLRDLNGQEISGYEIHMGQTTSNSAWLSIDGHDGAAVRDGGMSADGRVWGCYLHGIFGNIQFRRAWLRSIGWTGSNSLPPSLDEAFDRYADTVEESVNMPLLESIIGLK